MTDHSCVITGAPICKRLLLLCHSYVYMLCNCMALQLSSAALPKLCKVGYVQQDKSLSTRYFWVKKQLHREEKTSRALPQLYVCTADLLI